MDIVVAIIALFFQSEHIKFGLAFGLFTALSRPLSGDPFIEVR
jgi:hypothetical protein